MRDPLLDYYDSELRFIRRMAADFGRTYKDAADQLMMSEEGRCEDPHVERLIQAFAILTARIRLRLDDEFPEITDALLEILQPHALAPIPPRTIVQFRLDPEHPSAAKGVPLERGTLLHSAIAIEGVRCRFRTCYPLTLWPVSVAVLEIVPFAIGGPGVDSAVRIVLRAAPGHTFATLPLDRLCFYVDGDGALANSLHETLLRDPRGVRVRFRAGGPGGDRLVETSLPAAVLRQVGFERDEGLIDYDPGMPPGGRLLLEYFAFEEKFRFVEIAGLERSSLSEAGDEIELLVLLGGPAEALIGKLGPANLKLGCTPVVNLFQHHADPITLKHVSVEQHVEPDRTAPLAYEIHTITNVESAGKGGAAVAYEPLYTLRHRDGTADTKTYWHARRTGSSLPDDHGTDVLLTLVDRGLRFLESQGPEVVHVDALCTNRDLAGKLPFGDPGGDFQMEGRAGLARVVALFKPKPALRPPRRQDARLRLLSQFGLNSFSLVDDAGGASAPAGRQAAAGAEVAPALGALREALSLYDHGGSQAARQRINGLVGVHSRRIMRRLATLGGMAHAWGLEVTLEFDEARYPGYGLFLFASVLERHLAHSTSINSFTETVVRLRNRDEEIKRWPPRAGESPLL